jgi:hypothetical protein
MNEIYRKQIGSQILTVDLHDVAGEGKEILIISLSLPEPDDPSESYMLLAIPLDWNQMAVFPLGGTSIGVKEKI